MSEAAVAVEVVSEPIPLGSLDSVKDFRSRRDEANPGSPLEVAEPAEKPAAVEKIEPEPDASAAGKALAQKKGSLQSRIDTITAERHATAAERDAAKAEAAALKAELAALKAGKAPEKAETTETADPDDPEPKVETYDDYAPYLRDVAKWDRRQEARAETVKADTAKAETARKSADEAFRAMATSFIERRDAFAAEHEDFETVAMPFLETLTSGTPIGDVLMESESGPALALHLAQHPETFERIAKLAPVAQIRALGRLEKEIETPAPVVEKPKPVSKAPAPVKVPAASESAVTPDPSNVTSVKTWRAMRQNY